MIPAAIIAASGGATVVALFVWWVVRTIRSSERRVANLSILHREARAELTAKTDALTKMEAAYALLDARFAKLLPIAIGGASSADAVELSGGDPGPRPSDGLLEPDWDGDGHPGGAVPSR